MKKLISTLVLIMGLTTSLFAETGKVDKITVNADRTAVTVNGVWSAVNLIDDDLKSFVAIALTAKASGSDVTVSWANGGWVSISY